MARRRKYQYGGGISTGAIKREGAREEAAQDIAEQVESEQKKEGGLQGLLGMGKPLFSWLGKQGLGSLTKYLGGKAGLTGLANVMSGGMMSPILMGLMAATAAKGTKSLLKGAGMGGDPSKIKSTSKYGYGKEAAKTYREGLKESQKSSDPFSGESLGMDVLGQFASSIAPGIPGVGGETGKGGDLFQIGKDKDWSKLWSAGKKTEEYKLPWEEFNKLQEGGLVLPQGERGRGSLLDLIEMTAMQPRRGLGEGYYESDLYNTQMMRNEANQEFLSKLGFKSDLDYLEQRESGRGGRGEQKKKWDILDKLEAGEDFDISSLFQEGGLVSGRSKTPSIADYFSMQGKTLGGSNKKSVAEMLKRR